MSRLMSSAKIPHWTLIPVLLTAVGIVAPLVWDWYKSKSSIELQHLTTTTLVESSKDLERMRIFYGTKPIPSLSLLEFALVNSGRSPILERDVIASPRIVFGPGGDLLEFRRERLTPINLMVKSKFDPEGRTLEITFPLLNPGDGFQFGILVGGAVPSFRVEARIARIDHLMLIDKTTEANAKSKHSPKVAPIVAIIIVASLFALGASHDYFKVSKISQLFRVGLLRVPKRATKSEYHEFVEKVFDYSASDGKSKARNLISQLPVDGVATDQQSREIEGALGWLFEHPGWNRRGFTVFILAILFAELILVLRCSGGLP